ncbi:LysR family transcriptional regulator [Streptomyces sp. NPDC005865]|uniref:LysR family transcriptional regulator n=1 Tax=Streptomyces sp. NPDC005865 TaxID=3155453 RepID=UPI0033EEA8CD
MELRQLRYFVAVAEELHFGRAAERLHIVQPTVSQQIRRLEREFGLDLFRRTTRTVTLTRAGEAFLPHAQAILDAERAAGASMADLRAEQQSTLKLGTSTGLGSHLDDLLGELGRQDAQLTVELISMPRAKRLQQVRTGELDAAIIRGADPTPDLELLPLWQDTLVAALPARHHLADRQRIELAELAELPLRITSRDTNPHLVDAVVDACRAAGFTPVLGPAFTTDQDTLAAVATGRPSWTVYYAAQAEHHPAPRVAFRPLANPTPTVPAYLAVRPDPPGRPLTRLLAACRHLVP